MAASLTVVSQDTFLNTMDTWTTILSAVSSLSDEQRTGDGEWLTSQEVVSINIHNNDSATHIIQIRKTYGTNSYILRTVTLAQYDSELIAGEDRPVRVLRKSELIEAWVVGTTPAANTVSVSVVPRYERSR